MSRTETSVLQGNKRRLSRAADVSRQQQVPEQQSPHTWTHHEGQEVDPPPDFDYKPTRLPPLFIY